MDKPNLTARFIPQAWVNGNLIEIDGACDFDATKAILQFDVTAIRPLKDNHDKSDDLALDLPACKAHISAGMPYRVEVTSSLDAWLKLNGIEDREEMSETQWKELVASYPTYIELKVDHDALFMRFKQDTTHHIDQLWRTANATVRSHLQGALAGLNIMAASLTGPELLAEFRDHLDKQAAKIAEKNNKATT
jgi:hypothetical protein